METPIELFSLLIVEDDEEMRSVLREILQPVTPSILEAGNGEEALQLLSEHNVATILSDVNMGPTSGIALSRRARIIGIRSPIVLISGDFPSELDFPVSELQPCRIVAKPFANEFLLETVSSSFAEGLQLLSRKPA